MNSTTSVIALTTSVQIHQKRRVVDATSDAAVRRLHKAKGVPKVAEARAQARVAIQPSRQVRDAKAQPAAMAVVAAMIRARSRRGAPGRNLPFRPSSR